MASSSEKIIEVSQPLETALQVVEQALREIKASVSEINRQNGVVLGEKGMSFKSVGEDIRVVVAPLSSGGCAIWIQSQSSWPTTMVDWGVNSDNVMAIERALVSRLSSRTIQYSTPTSLNCPHCGQVDAVLKVSALYEHGFSTQTYQRLIPPPPGTNWAPLLKTEEHTVQNRLSQKLSPPQRPRNVAEVSAWLRAMDKWNQLYYCARDDGVFIPGGQYSPASQMNYFIYQ